MWHVTCVAIWFVWNMRVSIVNLSLVLCNDLVCRDHVAGSMDDVEVDCGRFPHRQALPPPPLPPLSVAALVCG